MGRDEVESSNRLRTDDANRRSGMESSRQVELVASGVILPSLLASLQKQWSTLGFVQLHCSFEAYQSLKQKL